MAWARLFLIGLAATCVAAPAAAQLPFLRKPLPPPPEESAPAPPPPPDPKVYWDKKEVPLEDRFDPLGDRRASRAEASAPRPVANGVDPLLYRLWGLQPLQLQLVRGREAIIEAWVRPSGDVRQAVIRITVRSDGRAFVQARAGLGCCRAEIARRVDIDQELPAGSGDAFLDLAKSEVWSQPEEVIAAEKGEQALEAVCVNGVSYDLTLMSADAVRHLRRNCDYVEVGSIAPLLGPVVGAALGREPLFDFLFPRGAGYAEQAEAYRGLVASGGRLTPRTR